MPKCNEVLRALFREGWFVVRQRGSHMVLKHAKRPSLIVFPNHGSDEIGKGLFKKILKQSGLKNI